MTKLPCSTDWRRPSFLRTPVFDDLDAVAGNRLGQAGLWPHSISGDLPIVLVRVAGEDETVVRQLLQWRIYTRRRGMKFDLVILDERGGEPSDQLRKELETGVASEMLGKAGGVFFLNADKVRPTMKRSCSRRPRGLYSAVIAVLSPSRLVIVLPQGLFLRRHSLRLQSRQSLSRNLPDRRQD